MVRGGGGLEHSIYSVTLLSRPKSLVSIVLYSLEPILLCQKPLTVSHLIDGTPQKPSGQDDARRMLIVDTAYKE